MCGQPAISHDSSINRYTCRIERAFVKLPSSLFNAIIDTISDSREGSSSNVDLSSEMVPVRLSLLLLFSGSDLLTIERILISFSFSHKTISNVPLNVSLSIPDSLGWTGRSGPSWLASLLPYDLHHHLVMDGQRLASACGIFYRYEIVYSVLTWIYVYE